MPTSAKVLMKSKASNSGIILTTFEVRFPRIILPEFNTYRVFSRNTSSSRAIPIAKYIEQIEKEPFVPTYWGVNQSGMSARKEMTPENAARAKAVWLRSRDKAVESVREMLSLEEVPHKQIINRLLEPWAYSRVVVSSTQWSNFFAQRIHEDAQPEICELAQKMWEAWLAAPTDELAPGDWHLPYIPRIDRERMHYLNIHDPDGVLKRALTVSTARCARVSYNSFEGRVTSYEEDELLAKKLLTAAPLHATPSEHQATPDTFTMRYNKQTKEMDKIWDNPKLHGNFVGFNQHRKYLDNENISTYGELEDPLPFY